MEVSRGDLRTLSREEIWDVSLRIRSMFLNTPMPLGLQDGLKEGIERCFGGSPVAVRPSACGQGLVDACLHEAYLNVTGVYSVLDHIRLVWGSLWSEAAILCRREEGPDAAVQAHGRARPGDDCGRHVRHGLRVR